MCSEFPQISQSHKMLQKSQKTCCHENHVPMQSFWSQLKKALQQRSGVWEKTLLRNPWKAKNIANGKLLFWLSWEELETKGIVKLKGTAESISVQLINYAFKRIWEDRLVILLFFLSPLICKPQIETNYSNTTSKEQNMTVCCCYRKIIDNANWTGLFSYNHKQQVFYTSYTTAICQQLYLYSALI